jgi:hypothetical protein
MRNNLKIRRFAILPALAQPITPVNSLLDPTMKARMFPLMRTFYMSVFYRIVVYVIHMPGKILLIGNQMFPEPPLPDASLSSFGSRCRYRHIPAAAGEPGFSEPCFYHAPSHRKIIIFVRHLPYTVTMIGQEHNPRYFERTQGPDFSYGPMQRRAGKFIAEYLPAIKCHWAGKMGTILNSNLEGTIKGGSKDASFSGEKWVFEEKKYRTPLIGHL